mgnify:CR=1 FL=1
MHAGNLLLRHHRIISAFGFALAVDREVRHALQIADDASEVVHILAFAVWALREITLVDVSAVVAQCVGDVEGEVVAAFHSRYAEQVAVLGLREVLFEIAVQGAAAGEVVDVATPVEAELLDGIDVLVFYHIEVAVVAIARHFQSISFVPRGILHP